MFGALQLFVLGALLGRLLLGRQLPFGLPDGLALLGIYVHAPRIKRPFALGSRELFPADLAIAVLVQLFDHVCVYIWETCLSSTYGKADGTLQIGTSAKA